MPRKTPLRVMIVEDSLDFLSSVLATLALEPQIEVVSTVISGEQALQKLGEVEPELILLDFRLPGLNGIEVAKRIKAQRPNVKIALLTAYAEEMLAMVSLPTLFQETNIIDLIPKLAFSPDRIRELLKLFP